MYLWMRMIWLGINFIRMELPPRTMYSRKQVHRPEERSITVFWKE